MLYQAVSTQPPSELLASNRVKKTFAARETLAPFLTALDRKECDGIYAMKPTPRSSASALPMWTARRGPLKCPNIL
jgi:hypothetical protein